MELGLFYNKGSTWEDRETLEQNHYREAQRESLGERRGKEADRKQKEEKKGCISIHKGQVFSETGGQHTSGTR